MFRRSPRTDTGAAAVEFALVVPILVTLLLGIITTGLTYSNSLGLKSAVREGARFGATADASPGAAASAWGANVIQRVRDTQFDDPSNETKICVQLWRVGSGAIAGTTTCSSGTPTLAAPSTATDAPAVPANAVGSCVVRIIAARPFTINIGVASWDRVDVTSAIARYERKDKIPTCQ